MIGRACSVHKLTLTVSKSLLTENEIEMNKIYNLGNISKAILIRKSTITKN